MMHGQTRVEFIFGVIIFAVIIFYVVNQMNTISSSIISDYNVNNMKAEAINVIKFLAETGNIEKTYLAQTPADVVLVVDISASMDGKQSPLGGPCRKTCDKLGYAPPPAPNGCGNFNSTNSGGDWYFWNEVWPNCTDCDNITHPADNGVDLTAYGSFKDRADPNEPCPINDVKYASKILVDQLNETTDRSALVCFDTYAFLRKGLNSSKSVMENAIDNGIYDLDGSTAIGEGINNATNLLKNTGNTSSKWFEILLTDGQDSPAEPYPYDPVSRAREAAANNITIFTIEYAQDNSFLDEPQLIEIANVTGGKYFYAPNESELNRFFGNIVYEIKTKTTMIGLLTEQPYNLSKSKIYNLNQDCSKMDVFNLGTYRLKVYNSTDLMLFCGTDTLRPPKIFVSKYVSIENDAGNITLELW